MSQLRKDPVTDRWVIITVEDPKNPEYFAHETRSKSSRICPFCPGNEAMTPPEIAIYGKKPLKGTASWQVRVVPNKFPALRIEETPTKQGLGVYDKIGGFGAHEVIIENPDHEKELTDLTLDQVELVLKAYRDRCLDLRKDPRFKYILIFKNYGASAGASLEHPHSQLIALPVAPSRVAGEIKGSHKHFEHTERCIYCDMLDQEAGEKTLSVVEQNGFIAIEPFASRFPFETWILPRQHQANFDAITDTEISALAFVLQSALKRIKSVLRDPSYNFMIHTLPLQGTDGQYYHWHIEIIPHLTRVAGFELGTGFYVNPTPPELAAEALRNASPDS